MKSSLSVVIGIFVVVVLATYMFTFTVRYDEVAILTTFNRADEPRFDDQGGLLSPGSVRSEPRLYFRLPWPIQQVTVYPTRLQLLEDQLEEQQTADANSLIVKTYLAWTIEDPLAFFRRLQTIGEAQQQLHALLRDTKAVISRYDFTELANTDASRLKLRQVEQEMLEQVRGRLAATGYGIRVEQVGIRQLVLPERVTDAVFERMKSTRQRMAERARSEGAAQAAAIRSEAESASKRILAFAEQRALELRAEGDSRAAQYYDVFNQDQDLAAFLRRLETLKAAVPGATIVMPADQISPDGGLMRPNFDAPSGAQR